MMLPMKRSEVFKILVDIFHQPDIKNKMFLTDIMMRESTGEPYDIDFWCESTESLVGYLHIINPPKDCVDGKYYFEYHSSISQKDGNIGIDSSGTISVYSDVLNSFIYDTIKNNMNRLADYAKKLTRTYHEQVADTVVSVVKTYCETLMNEHASIFDQMDTSVFNGCDTHFLIRSTNEPERDFMFFAVKNLDKYNIKDNEIRVRVSKPDCWIWTPLFIRPAIGDIAIYIVQPVFTDIFGVKEVLRLARLISERTGFAISVIEGDSTRDKNIAKYIKSLLQKHEVIDEVLDTVKQYYATEKMNNENNKSLTSIVDDAVDKKINEFVKTGSMYYTTKDYLCSKICEQLALRQQEIFRMIYSAIYCTLAESKYPSAAYKLERHFMQLVSTDKDDNGDFHVYFKLDDIYKDLPRFDIEFNQCCVYIRIQEFGLKEPFVVINKKIRVYTQDIRFMKDTYKTIVSHVASKIVLMEGLS